MIQLVDFHFPLRHQSRDRGSVMMVVMDLTGSDKGLDGFPVSRCMAAQFAAIANALIRLQVRAGGNLLQAHLHRFAALGAFEVQKTCRFVGHVNIP